jgi:hypoxanthine phosphoribosyltransferase
VNRQIRVKRLIEAAQIQERVAQLGRQITAEYDGRPLTVIGVLTGSLVLVSDLIRSIELPIRVGMIRASSYAGRTTAGTAVSLDLNLLPDIGGRDVLIVDDVFDSGRTLTAIVEGLRSADAASVRAAVLLWKDRPRETQWTPHYFGFKIPDVFVVGYGLDYNDEHRSLPYVAALDPDDL